MTALRAERWKRLAVRWVGLVSQRRWWVVAVVLALTAATLQHTIDNLRIDTDRNKAISGDLPFKQRDEQLRREFPQSVDNLALVVDAETPELARATVRRLAARLSSEPELFGSVYLPATDDFLERHALLYLGFEELEELTLRLAEIQPFLGRLTSDPSLRGLFGMLESAFEARAEGQEADLAPIVKRIEAALNALVSAKRYRLSWQELMRDQDSGSPERRQIIQLKPPLDYGQLLAAKPVMNALREMAQGPELNGSSGARLRITGGLALAHEELETVTRGMKRIGILVSLMVTLVLVVGLRSLRLVLATLVTLFSGLTLTAFFATVAVNDLNLVSVAFAALYLGLGVDYAIHLCLRYQDLSSSGMGHLEAMQAAVLDVGGSLVLCSITTSLGFFAFVPTSYAGVGELGLISGVGMFISLFVSLTLLPALLAIMPLTPGEGAGRRRTQAGLKALFEALAARRGGVLLGAAGLAALTLVLLPRVRFDPNPLNLRDSESESVATFEDLLRTSVTPPWSVALLAETPAEARSLAQAIAPLAAVDKVITVQSFVPEDQDEKLELIEETALVLGGVLVGPGSRPAPEANELRESIANLREVLQSYLQAPPGNSDSGARDLSDALDSVTELLDAAAAGEQLQLLRRLEISLLETLPENLERLRVAFEARAFAQEELPSDRLERWVSRRGMQRIEVFPTDRLEDVASMRSFVEAVRSVAPDAAGGPVNILESGDAVVRAFREAILVALIAIGVMVLVLLRNPWEVLLVLGPLVMAGALTGATMAALDIPFNFANVIGLPLLLGVGVDNGIHMVHRARGGLVKASGILSSSTARAVVYSALTTLCSFANLSLSEHPGTASLGQVLTIGIAFTLLATLVGLPALLGLRSARSRAAE